MLNIIRSNRVESLLVALAQRVSDAPLSSPFGAELVVVPSPAMARWVNLQLALRTAVAANFRYPLPASFVWQLSGDLLDDLPEQDPLHLDLLAWKIFGELPGLVEEPGFEPLRHYLGTDAQGLKRFQLSNRIADVLDRYQLYRPELIRGWDAGQGDDWQARLWRRLAKDVGRRHRIAVIDRLLETLDAPGPFDALPERVSLFAVSSLPPLLVTVFQVLADHVEVDLYLHAPTDAFWADLVSRKALARKRLERPDEARLWEAGNSLLTSWGRQGQALQDLLLSREMPVDEIDAFAEPSSDDLLSRLQQDIFSLQPIAADDQKIPIDGDNSVQVHICHSPLRECQVLHDQLLRMLEADADLRPEDILVMVPEISLYAPYIEAVFGPGDEGGRPFLPWNLSDISVKDEHPLVQVFLHLLALPASRFSRSEILSYLDVPEVAEHFGLDKDAVDLIRGWLDRANLRWGLNGDHKQRLGLPGTEENTWAQAEKRLLAGYAMGESSLFGGIAPIGNPEGRSAEAFGRFLRLLSKLTDAASHLAPPRSAVGWQATIGVLIRDFFGERDDEDGRLQRIRDAAADLADKARGLEEPLAPDLVRNWLEQRLGAESRHGRYFSGGVTFCGMRPMRSLPFQVICVLGLNDQAFPRRGRQADLDLMLQDWRPGDPRKGDEDRYLFLETLLCARSRLYLSYVGRDIRNNTERQPSVLVRELLEYTDQQYRIANGTENGRPSAHLTRTHPLQPFSRRNFSRTEGSYDQYWCDLAKAMQQPAAPQSEQPLHWPGSRLPEAPERMRDVTLEQLDRFIRHPVRYLVNSRLQVYLRAQEPEDDEEPFGLDGLQSFLLKRRLVDDHLNGRTTSRRQLSAEGTLPHGALAGLVLEAHGEHLDPLIGLLQDYRQQVPGQIPVDLEIAGDQGPRRLTGQVKNIYPELGLLRWKPSALKGPDILSLWLAHLAWCAAGEPGEKRSALHTTGESFVIEQPLAPAVARSRLELYLSWYWEAVHRPLPALPGASYAFALKSLLDGKGDPMNAARSKWQGNSYMEIPGDKDDPYVQLVMRGVSGDPLEHREFAALAIALYEPALSSGELA